MWSCETSRTAYVLTGAGSVRIVGIARGVAFARLLLLLLPLARRGNLPPRPSVDAARVVVGVAAGDGAVAPRTPIVPRHRKFAGLRLPDQLVLDFVALLSVADGRGQDVPPPAAGALNTARVGTVAPLLPLGKSAVLTRLALLRNLQRDLG